MAKSSNRGCGFSPSKYSRHSVPFIQDTTLSTTFGKITRRQKPFGGCWSYRNVIPLLPLCIFCVFYRVTYPKGLTVCHWKMVVGRLLSYWVLVTLQGLCKTLGAYLIRESFSPKPKWTPREIQTKPLADDHAERAWTDHPFWTLKWLHFTRSDLGVSKNRCTPKWMVYNGNPY